MFLILCLFSFLPYLNIDGCESGKNGFSCEELNKGIEILKNKISKNSTKNNFVKVISKSNDVENIAFCKILETILAIGTNSASASEDFNFFSDEKEERKIEIKNIENMKYENFSLCFDNESLDYNVTFIVDALPSVLLLTPKSVQFFDEIGPSFLHIISNYALNVKDLQRVSNLTDKSKLIKHCSADFGLTEEKSFINLVKKGNKILHRIGDLKGWLSHIILGTSPYVFDPVSRSCWNGTTYLSGGISAIYPGVKRSKNDLQRMNTKCKDVSNTKKMLRYIL